MADDRPVGGPRPTIGLMVLGSEMVSFTLFGLLLDYLFKTLPGFTIGLTVLGFVAVFAQLIRMSRNMGKATRRGQDGSSGGSA